MTAVKNLRSEVGTVKACAAFLASRATFYRWFNPVPQPGPRPAPPLALNSEERQTIIDLLHSPRFQDDAPSQVYAVLLDEGQYYCSVRTMYRILEHEHGEVKERRNQVRRPYYKKPELLATQPNQVWSWDITKLKGPAKWTYFYLYVILDIFSRYVVGWMVAHREQNTLAKRLMQETCDKQAIIPGQLNIHADRGPSMTSKCVAQFMADMGVTKTHSRPYVSNDNPYSEAQFKTLKYCPSFPERFGSIQDARGFCQDFFTWYNTEHRHSGIGLMTPEQIHYGLAGQIMEYRRGVLKEAFAENPRRFKSIPPQPPSLPEAVWINKPNTQNARA